MGNRSMKRQIARHMMELAGIEQINKKKYDVKKKVRHQFGIGEVELDRKSSYFAIHWKNYLDPESKERRALHSMLRRKAALEAKKDPKRKGKRILPWPCGYRFVEVRK